MSEFREGEDPFFSSIRVLKAMVQPKATHLDRRSANEGVVTSIRTTNRDTSNASLLDKSSIQTIRNVLIDLQAKLEESEEVAAKEMVLRLSVERERDELVSRLKTTENAATENKSCREALEKELDHARLALRHAEEVAAEEIFKIKSSAEQESLQMKLALNDAEELVAKEKSLRDATEQLLLEMRVNVQDDVTTEAQHRSNLERKVHDLQDKLYNAESTIEQFESMRIVIEQQLNEAKRALEEKESLLSHEKLMRREAEQELSDMRSKLSSARIDENEKLNLQSSLVGTERAISEEKELRLVAEQERDRISQEFEEAKKDWENQTKRRNHISQTETPIRNAQVIDDLSAKLSAAEATAEKEKQQRLAVEQERDEVLLECREARILFESPGQGDPYLLKKEAQRLLTTRIEERKKHLKEMDRLHLQLQRAVSQRDSMEARLQGSKKITDNLSNELEVAYSRIRELSRDDEEDRANDINSSKPGKRARTDDTDPTTLECE